MYYLIYEYIYIYIWWGGGEQKVFIWWHTKSRNKLVVIIIVSLFSIIQHIALLYCWILEGRPKCRAMLGGGTAACVLWFLDLVHMHMLCRRHSIPIFSTACISVLSLFMHRHEVNGLSYPFARISDRLTAPVWFVAFYDFGTEEGGLDWR